MMCSCQNLELYGDCIILQKLSARSFRSHPVSVINLPHKYVVRVYSLMKGQVLKWNLLTSGIANYKLKGIAQVYAVGSRKKILGQNGGTSIQRLHMRCGAVLEQSILRIWILYSMSLLASRILLVIHWFMIPLCRTFRGLIRHVTPRCTWVVTNVPAVRKVD